MTKNRGLAIGVLGIILALFNVVVFVTPFEHTSSFWFCYGFTILAILIQAFVVYLAVGKANTMKSRFIGFPIIYIGYIYLLLQFSICLIFMTLTIISIWISIIVQTLILGITAICLIATEVGRDEINRVEQVVKEKVFFIKNNVVELECMLSTTENALLRKKLIGLIDIVKYSDPMSNDNLRSIEAKIEGKTAELGEAVETSENNSASGIIDEIKVLFEERNKKCKILK